VLVGAGTTGAVVAARLRERGHSVLLLEAGAEQPRRRGLDPFAALAASGRTWDGLVAIHTPGGEQQPYWQGRGVGGTSAVNGMMGAWGSAADYDGWECDGWSWLELQPARQRVEATLPLRCVRRLGPVSRAFEARAPLAGIDTERARFTVEQARRVTVVDAYGGTARPDAEVDRVLIENRRAVGVRLVGGEEIAATEVVLCAGAIHSPAVLLRSGVERVGIGRNLQDHPAVRVVLPLTPLERVPDRRRLPFAIVGRRGDLQFVPMDYTDDTATGGVTVALMAAHSRGRVTLVADRPHVQFEQLVNDRDRSALETGIRLVEQVLPGAEGPAVDDLGDVFHAAGTCRMGDPTDDDAVVDTRGRVIGYDGLRVADASIMPSLPRANPMLTCVLIGERLVERW
jgi:choline dehydrogenase-like flavoprotein